MCGVLDIDLTVVVATCNRSSSLVRLLTGFQECERPANLKWEVLIVDNNSTDDTGEVTARAKQRFPYVRSVFEAHPGVSHARNRGAAEACGRYLFFIDDDASPSRRFLTGIEKALETYPDVVCFGTRIRSHFPDKPKWFATEGPYALIGVLGSYDLGDCDKILEKGEPLPIGCGLMVEKKTFFDYGPFDTDLGITVQSKDFKRGEDTFFVETLARAGQSICYLSEPVVDHYPDLSRYRLDHLKKMYFSTGVSLAGKSMTTAVRWFGVPRYLIREVIGYVFRIVLCTLRHRGDACVFYMTRYWLTLGMIAYYLGLNDTMN